MSVVEDGLTIVLDFAPPYFLPGHPVAGRLIVSSKEGVSTRGLSIVFHGEIHNSWSASSSSLDGSSSTTSWDAHEILFNFPQIFLAGDHALPAGNSVFPFSFRLPHNMPSSVHCLYGRVEYSLNVCLERSWAIDWVTEMSIPVMGLLDLQPYPLLNQPSEFYSETEFGCLFCPSKPMRFWCSLNKTGFYPGERIKFRVRIEDRSRTEIRALWAELNQNFTFWAEGDRQRQTYRVNEVGRETSPASRADFWQGELLVPLCAPTGLGGHGRVRHLIQMIYTLDIIADVSGCCTVNPKVMCYVTIGSLPQPPPAQPQEAVPLPSQLPKFAPQERRTSRSKFRTKNKQSFASTGSGKSF